MYSELKILYHLRRMLCIMILYISMNDQLVPIKNKKKKKKKKKSSPVLLKKQTNLLLKKKKKTKIVIFTGPPTRVHACV